MTAESAQWRACHRPVAGRMKQVMIHCSSVLLSVVSFPICWPDVLHFNGPHAGELQFAVHRHCRCHSRDSTRGRARPGTKADNSVAQLTIKSAVLESCSVVSLSVLLALCRFVKEVHHPFCTTVCSLQIAFVHSGRALTSHLPCHGKPIKDLFQARTALLLQHLAECIQNPTRAPKVPLSIS